MAHGPAADDANLRFNFLGLHELRNRTIRLLDEAEDQAVDLLTMQPDSGLDRVPKATNSTVDDPMTRWPPIIGGWVVKGSINASLGWLNCSPCPLSRDNEDCSKLKALTYGEELAAALRYLAWSRSRVMPFQGPWAGTWRRAPWGRSDRHWPVTARPAVR